MIFPSSSSVASSLAFLWEGRPFSVRLIQLLVAAPVLLLTLVSLNGHLLYFVDLPSSPWSILALVVIETSVLFVWLRSQRVRLVVDWYEATGLILIVTGVWVYLILPSLPTLLPPSSSGDAANHAAFSESIYASGYLITGYPAGAAVVVATLAHWLGLPTTLALIHPVASFLSALTAGGVYGLACAMLPDTRKHKTLALFTLGALLIPWGYFAGMLIGGDYFFTQTYAQLLVVVFIWFLHAYLDSSHPFWLVGMALALIGVAMTWPLWMPLPVAVLGWVLFMEWRRGRLPSNSMVLTFTCVVVGLALYWVVLLVTSFELFPVAVRVLMTSTGDILSPSPETLGGLYLVMPLLGLFLILKSGYRSRVETAFFLWVLAQTATLLILHRFAGLAAYYTYKTFYFLILPMALFAIVPLARVLDLISAQRVDRLLNSRYILAPAILVLGAFLFFFQPAPERPALAQSDIDVALWAREQLPTANINLIGKKGLAPSWIGVGIWGEKYPADLFVDWAALGPKTFEEWRSDPAWGDYLFVMSKQKMPPDSTLQTVYQSGNSAILARPPAEVRAQNDAPIARVGDILEVERAEPIGQVLMADGSISMTIPVKTLALPARHVVWRVKVLDRNLQEVASQDIEPFDGRFLLQRWPIGKTISQSISVPIPPALEPGLYNVQLSLFYVGSVDPLPTWLPNGDKDDGIELVKLKVPVSSSVTNIRVPPTNAVAQFGPAIYLLSYQPSQTHLHPGDSLNLRLLWQCADRVSKDYQVFVHILDAKGMIVAQDDGAPRDDNYPTSIWDPGEIISDAYNVTLDKNTASGIYRLEIGIYDLSTGERLHVETPSGESTDDRLVLPQEIVVGD